MEPFNACVVDKRDKQCSVRIDRLHYHQLPAGNVVIKVSYSGINYKDRLAASADGRVVRHYPMVLGIDLAGTVVSSEDSRFQKRDEVLLTGYDLGTSHFGGFSEYARVPADWLVPVPDGLSVREAMIFGTAGFTAALSIHRMEAAGLKPENGPLLIRGATGGVGVHAVAMLADRGYHVTASTGKQHVHHYLQSLGAHTVIDREQVAPALEKPLLQEQWAGVVDPVGGPSLSRLVSAMQYGGMIALSGLTGGTDFATSVFPFILRGIQLIGIDSVFCPMPLRLQIWKRMATDLKPKQLLKMVSDEITLEQLPSALSASLKGSSIGRTLVKIG